MLISKQGLQRLFDARSASCSLELDPFMWSSFEALCQLGADVDPDKLFSVEVYVSPPFVSMHDVIAQRQACSRRTLVRKRTSFDSATSSRVTQPVRHLLFVVCLIVNVVLRPCQLLLLLLSLHHRIRQTRLPDKVRHKQRAYLQRHDLSEKSDAGWTGQWC